MKSLRKKKDILSKAVKDRSADEKKMLRQYTYKLNKMKSNIIPDLLKKCPELRQQTKTGEPTEKRRRQAESAAERKSASRSRQDGNIDELEDIDTVNELNNERDTNDKC